MKRIPLNDGEYTLVDDADYDWLNAFKWRKLRVHSLLYATSNINKQPTLMHRLILELKYKDGKITDHIDGNGLNNCRANLRICTQQQNTCNRKIEKGRSSIYKGVSQVKKTGMFQASIGYKGEAIHLGYFTDELLAAEFYDEAAIKYHGEFARLNFP